MNEPHSENSGQGQNVSLGAAPPTPPARQESAASEASDPWYPTELKAAELKAVRTRREKVGNSSPIGAVASSAPSRRWPQNTVGVALSGGGIRSATFCLGVFQALARHKLVGKIDFLSTVSGGGYFGGFLGRMFTRPWIHGQGSPASPEGDRVSPCDCPDTCPPHGPDLAAVQPACSRVECVLCTPHSDPMRWLRDNGRYLSPNGGGDTWLALAVMLRNWVAVVVVMSMLALSLFLGLDLLRAFMWQHLPQASRALEWPLLEATRHRLWWSPWLLLPLITFSVAALPLGWAYWLTQSADSAQHPVQRIVPWATTDAIAVVAGVVILAAVWPAFVVRLEHYFYPAAAVCAAALLALSYWASATFWRHRDMRDTTRLRWARNVLSAELAVALGTTAGLLVFAVVDSLGQSLYAVFQFNGWNLISLKGLAGVTGLTTLVTLGTKAMMLLEKLPRDRKFQLPAEVLVAIVAPVLVGLVLVILAAVAHGFVWKWQMPAPRDTFGTEINPGRNIVAQFAAKDKVTLSSRQHIVVQDNRLEGLGKTAVHGMSLRSVLPAFLATVLLSLAFGVIIQFLNLSSLQQFYSARLTRAYLGASNPNRWTGAGQRLSEVVACDDVGWGQYHPHIYGGPLHLVNVTLNETVSGKSQIEFRDRKGLAMAIGPCGVSVGVGDHALWAGEADQADAKIRPLELRGFHALGVRPDSHPVEPLPLGNWVGISGAAIGTGLGAGTSLGKSLLLGMANIRLGYWWDSKVLPSDRKKMNRRTEPVGTRRVGETVNRFLEVQTYLLDEFLARFHGPARPRWYLSDGGHFENTGAYELIRRRIPLIILCDNGCDPNYEFADIANLVRKARTDFGAEIEFLKSAPAAPPGDRSSSAGEPPRLPSLNELVHPELLEIFGAPEDFRQTDSKTDSTHLAASTRKHALLARVWYSDTGERTWLLVIKPSVTGDEPQDIRHYTNAHPDFPQETTADQYFDEAQWESYRKLGEHIGQKLFAQVKEPQGRFWAPSDAAAGVLLNH